jgi:hypothetical protein
VGEALLATEVLEVGVFQEPLLSLADDCDAQAENLEKVRQRKVEADIVTKYAATLTAHHHRHRRRRSTR